MADIDIAELERLPARLRDMTACDPGCQGRCRECPDILMREGADAIDKLLSRLRTLAAKTAHREAAIDVLVALKGLCGLAKMRGGHLHEYVTAIKDAEAAIAKAEAAGIKAAS